MAVLFKHIYISNCINVRCYSKSNRYTNTVILPKTKFPLKLTGKKVGEQNKLVSEACGFGEVYGWQRSNLEGPDFVLHDGPPYANGPPHMGHVINKILKDIINRHHVLQGRKVEYIPGWDCHGLPIELKAMKNVLKSDTTPIYVRSKARGYATKTISEQSKVFQSWGVMGDWTNAYKTYNIPYIQNELRQFYKLYEKNLVFRDVKPVFWSPSSRTALAEAELEYNEKHTSTAAYVRYKLTRHPSAIEPYTQGKPVHAVIWTTTPWTLPSNQAICFNPNVEYSLVSSGSGDLYMMASDLVGQLSSKLNTSMSTLTTVKGEQLGEARYLEPFSNEELPFLAGEHATATKGTGLVHTAPAHGPDDFLLALKHDMAVKCMVDETGCYTSDAGPALRGLSVLSDGNQAVLHHLQTNLLKTEEHVHSYPYDWRTKQPVILRASQQWFINTDAIKHRAIELLDQVTILPERTSAMHKSNLKTQLKKRPYWCISRQRSWGVPIPVFYDSNTDQPIVSQSSVEHLCRLLDKYGSDCWWTLPMRELLPPQLADQHEPENIRKGQDIFDIWLDSGLSWSHVLSGDQIADMYVEGVDQFTGWFQSSLLTSVALRDKPPYRTIYVHGFAVDQNGHKMSKSLGNVVNPQDILNGSKTQPALGVDTLRWWVACHASHNSTASVSENILQVSTDEVQKIRNALRFAISVLDSPNTHDLPSPRPIDQYLLHLVWEFNNHAKQMYSEYQFNKLCIAVSNFVTNPVSALYYSVIKDRLYCEAEDDAGRRSAQYVVAVILDCVSRCIAPVLPHLVQELHSYRAFKSHENFYQSTPLEIKDEWNRPELNRIFKTVLDIRKEIYRVTVNPSNMNATITTTHDLYNDLQIFHDNHLIDVLQVAKVTLVPTRDCPNVSGASSAHFEVQLATTEKCMCDRCKRYTSEKANQLCDRCQNVIIQSDKDHAHRGIA